MDNVARSRQKWEDSAAGWIAGVDRGDVNRTHLLDGPMLRLTQGDRVLDIGCGEGRFCRMLRARGQSTIGLDPTKKLIERAQELDPVGAYLISGGEALPFGDGNFDLAVFYLTLIDIPDFRSAIAEAARVVRPGGAIVVANLQSYATTRPVAWYRNEQGEKLHVAVTDYYTERSAVAQWGRISILNFHRPMEAYMQAFLSAGLVLEHFSEPRPSLEAVEAFPSMRDEYEVPLFHVMSWRKV